MTHTQEEINARAEKLQNLFSEVQSFKTTAVTALTDLLTTDPEIQKDVEYEFYKAIAETDTTIKDVGKQIFQQYQELWLDQMGSTLNKDKVFDVQQYNVLLASLLSLIEPITNFTENDEKRREGLMHLLFIKAALRSIPIRFHGCPAVWEKEDQKLAIVKNGLLNENSKSE